MISKLQRDFMAADLANVESLLGELTASDFVARLNLESRRDEIKAALAAAESNSSPLASAVIFFGGQPVVGSQGIQSEFGAQAIALFQNLVAKVSASQANKTLAPVGPVSGKDQSRLYVTRIVHGSFGFQFDELEDSTTTPPLFDSSLKEAVDETAHLIAAFDEPDEMAFGTAVENMDTRILSTVRRFFALLDNSKATFRISAGNAEKQYGAASIKRAVERAKETTIEEQQEWFAGRLEGVLPTARDFEYRTVLQQVLRGKIDRTLSNEQIAALSQEWLNRDSQALVHIKRIRRQGRLSHTVYFLEGISAAVSEVETAKVA